MTRAKTKKRLTADEWFERAEQFEFAATALLEEERPGKPFALLGIPHVVCRAFAVEAYLKCLIESDNRAAPWAHNLASLFDQLSSADQKALSAAWKQEYAPRMRAWNKQKVKPKGMGIGRMAVSLRGALQQCGDAFLLFRYGPEKGTAPFMLMNFPLSIRDYIITKTGLRPRFRSLPRNPNTKLVERKNDNLGNVTTGWAILNPKSASLQMHFRRNRNPNPNDGSSN